MARILFAPFSIMGGLLAGFIGTKIFQLIWGRFDAQEPPEPEDRETTWLKLGIALALQGAIFKLIRGAFDHGARRAFLRGTRTWPGEKKPDPA
ncbi:MAG: DUF4235 domain-containing protein [Actinomycetota bacterium]|nr:DUF4235 domain-containing protein [Actinomycetota bacterium]